MGRNKASEKVPELWRTTVMSTSPVTVDFAGEDEALLDAEVGRFQTQVEFILTATHGLHGSVGPDDPFAHPYLEFGCRPVPFALDPQTNFPVLADFEARGCTVMLVDRRGTVMRNQSASGSKLRLRYQACP